MASCSWIWQRSVSKSAKLQPQAHLPGPSTRLPRSRITQSTIGTMLQSSELSAASNSTFDGSVGGGIGPDLGDYQTLVNQARFDAIMSVPAQAARLFDKQPTLVTPGTLISGEEHIDVPSGTMHAGQAVPPPAYLHPPQEPGVPADPDAPPHRPPKGSNAPPHRPPKGRGDRPGAGLARYNTDTVYVEVADSADSDNAEQDIYEAVDESKVNVRRNSNA